ncbi:MAG: YARHG domain-containing protein [Alistipes sp.]|nr:YARHG domain-containing protein [Alistipes sp.]
MVKTHVQQNCRKGLFIGLIATISLLSTPLSTFATTTNIDSREQNTGVVTNGVAVAEDIAKPQPVLKGHWPFTSSRYISESDLYGMSLADLRIMRNEIYARHGYIFKTQEMKQYFAQQSWYRPISANVTLSQIEQHNVSVIKAYESKLSRSNTKSSNGVGVGLYPFTSTRKLTYSDIAHLSAYELRIMRNEIYARHGYIFKTQDMREYFSAQSWYRPTTHNVTLSSIEQYNVSFIKQYE